MKIAIDCSGTLLSPHYQPQLLVFVEEALNKGHEITIWSSISSYITDAVRILNAAQIKGRERVVTCTKVERVALGEDQAPWDIAIDDQDLKSTYLAAERIVHPKDLKNISL